MEGLKKKLIIKKIEELSEYIKKELTEEPKKQVVLVNQKRTLKYRLEHEGSVLLFYTLHEVAKHLGVSYACVHRVYKHRLKFATEKSVVLQGIKITKIDDIKQSTSPAPVIEMMDIDDTVVIEITNKISDGEYNDNQGEEKDTKVLQGI